MVPITSFTASDNVGVTGYMAAEASAAPLATDPAWTVTAPTSYAFGSAGSKTLYAWAKDAAGGVSESEVATVTISVTPRQTNQYAGTVLGYSSTFAQWAWDRGSTNFTGYIAGQALGAPNVSAYGDNRLAWAPYATDGTLEYIALGFATPVYANGVTVRV
jgi:hypothetical protein